jgi:uncharacterized protein YjiS (DUF1127 family)
MECTGARGELLVVDLNRGGATEDGAGDRAGDRAGPRTRPIRVNLLFRTFSWILRWHRIRRDEALLLRQSDYMLRDIGLGRAEIELAVRGQAWRGRRE